MFDFFTFNDLKVNKYERLNMSHGWRQGQQQTKWKFRIHQWLYCHQLYASVKPELPSSETFKKHQHIEKNRIVTKSLNDLQNNILR